jgi:hypothetical protein
MAKRKASSTGGRKLRPVTDDEIDAAIASFAMPADTGAGSDAGSDDGSSARSTPLHDLFNQQVRSVLDASDLNEEEKQSILVAMNCPCCGGGAGMLTYKLKKK